MIKNHHNNMIKVKILPICIIIMLTMPMIATAKQQSFSKKSQSIESPPNYHIIMFGRIFNPHIENNNLCFRAINVICLVFDYYDYSGASWKLYHLGWFRHMKISIYCIEHWTSRRIFVNSGCNDLPFCSLFKF
jgi:hypothetical protein